MEIVKILLIAIGGYGANYMKELTEKNVTNAKIEGICEVMPGIEKRFPIINEKNIPLYQNIEDFYQEHEADLAVIATPMHLHYSQAKYCMEHGSDVLLEKPVCTTLEDAEEFNKGSERNRKVYGSRLSDELRKRCSGAKTGYLRWKVWQTDFNERAAGSPERGKLLP